MAIRQEIIDAFQKDMDRKKQRQESAYMIHARKKYLDSKKRGDYSIVVDEWDLWEEEIAKDLQNKNIKGEIMMSDRRVLVRLSKAFNNVEVEVNNILTPEEFNSEVLWAKNEAYKLIDMLPNEKIDTYLTKPNNQTRVTPNDYIQATKVVTNPPVGNITSAHITTKFLKGKQINIALKGINEGKYTLDQVNGLQSWDEQQKLLFPPRNY